jgi:small conductance mechanosensitive channel
MPDIDWDRVRDWLLTHGLRIVLIVALALAADLLLRRLVPHLLRPLVQQRMKGKLEEEVQKRLHTLTSVLEGTGRAVLVAWAIFTILPEAGVTITPILASVGIVGIALGFGAQSLVRDTINGLFILMDNQYSQGDVVTVAGISGRVEDVGLRRTVLRDLDGVVHYVPNGHIAVASNLTQEWSRVNLNVSVAYGEDIDRVFAIIDRVGRELAADPQFAPLIISPPRALRVESMSDTGVAIKVLGDTQPVRQWEVTGELRRRLIRAFLDENVRVPFPPHVVATSGTS